MAERGRQVDQTTSYRWVQRYAPELAKRVRAPLQPTNDSWRVDETYSKVRGCWMYLDRAVARAGHTLAFMRSPYRPAGAAQCCFRKARGQAHTVLPRGVHGDQNAAYPSAVEALQADGTLKPPGKLRPVKSLNNILEPDH